MFSRRVTRAMYFKCCMSQKFLISVLLVISLIASLLNLKDQPTSPSGIDLSFLEHFFLEKPPFTKRLKNPHQPDSNFRISSVPSCQACTEYNKRLRAQASKNFTRVDLSRKKDFISFHLGYALDIWCIKKADDLEGSLQKTCQRYLKLLACFPLSPLLLKVIHFFYRNLY